MKKERIFIVVAVVALFIFIWFMQSKGQKIDYDNLTFPQLTTEISENERVVEMETSLGTIKMKLFEEQAPKAVENFITHSENGYYEGVIFHRVIRDFMIQGGDPTGTGSGGESIYGGFFENEITPELYHIRGALSMANAGPDTNTSQFFIVQNHSMEEDYIRDMEKADYPEEIIEAYKDGGTPWLDGAHTVFGQVLEGMDVVDKIAFSGVDADKKPMKDVVIKKITVIK